MSFRKRSRVCSASPRGLVPAHHVLCACCVRVCVCVVAPFRSVHGQREITAFFGSLVPIVCFGVARELGLSHRGAFFAALLMITDVFNVIEAR